MMSGFWSERLAKQDGFIFDANTGQQLSYCDLNQQINLWLELNLHKKVTSKSLFALEANNQLAVLIAYLALLRANQCILLFDPNLDVEQKNRLFERYQVDYQIDFDVNNTASLVDSIMMNKTGHDATSFIHCDIAVLLSTSGSTGSPKLVKLSCQNLQANCDSILDFLPIDKSDTLVTTLPMHYSFGLSVLHTHLHQGANIVLNDYNLMQKPFWQLIKQFKPQSFYGVPFSFQLLAQLGLKRLALTSVKYFAQAGGKMADELTKNIYNWCAEQGKLLYIMYGQTEATARIAYLNPSKLPEKIGFIGQAILNGKLKLIDEDGVQITQPEQVGELCYQGDNVCLGVAQTRQDLMVSGQPTWLATGDLACFDRAGDFKIVGRLKRFIKVTGKRINLDEVEMLFNQQLKVYSISSLACVTGDDDSLILVLTQVLDPILKNQLIDTIAKVLSLHSYYIQLQFMSDLPRLSNGKLDYKKLNKQLATQTQNKGLKNV